MPPRPSDGEEKINDFSIDDGEVQEVDLAPSGTPEGEATKVGMGGYEVSIDNRMLPYVGQFFAAMVLLIAVTVPKVEMKNDAYGISAAVIAMFFSLVGCYLVRSEELFQKPLCALPMVGNLTLGSGNAQFLFVWWFIAACILTFDSPFEVTSNGYFACWGGVIFAAMALGATPENMKLQAGGLGYFNGLLIASIIVICAVPQYIGKNEVYSSESIYALVVAILTASGVLAFGAYAIFDKFKFPFFVVFTLLWVVEACLVTFRGPFLQTGNGYFASWFGCILCAMAAAATRPQGE